MRGTLERNVNEVDPWGYFHSPPYSDVSFWYCFGGYGTAGCGENSLRSPLVYFLSSWYLYFMHAVILLDKKIFFDDLYMGPS